MPKEPLIKPEDKPFTIGGGGLVGVVAMVGALFVIALVFLVAQIR